jgi:hypothetical protein
MNNMKQLSDTSVAGVSLNQTTLTKRIGDPAVTLIATVSPGNATNRNVTWSTSDPSVATVSDGVVNFKGNGTATITVTTEDGNKTTECVVKIPFALGPLSWTLEKGTLTISGTGAIPTINSLNGYPWHSYHYHNAITSIIIEDGVTSIGDYAFASIKITVKDEVRSTTIEPHYDRLKSATLGNSVTSIGNNAFNYCKALSSVTLGNSIRRIGNSAFENCISLASIIIPDSVVNLGSSVFKGCNSLTSITIPNSVVNMGASVFEGCASLTSVILSDSVVNLDSSVFKGCTSLISVTLGSSIKRIGNSIFFGCHSLTNIVVLATTPPINPFPVSTSTSTSTPTYPSFNGLYLNTITLTVPKGRKAAYQSAYGWKDFGKIVEME